MIYTVIRFDPRTPADCVALGRALALVIGAGSPFVIDGQTLGGISLEIEGIGTGQAVHQLLEKLCVAHTVDAVDDEEIIQITPDEPEIV